jgi:hypothetical protein
MDAQFGITPKIVCLATCWTWILPSSHRFGFLHLIIHVGYVKGQTMLIRCCFAIIVMVDTISSTSSRNSLKFPSAFGTFIMFSCNTLIFTQTMPRFSWLKSWGGDTWEFHVSLFLCIVYICACISFWLISFYLWLVLIFLFSRVHYGFTPLRHHMSQHYTSQQLSCSYMA